MLGRAERKSRDRVDIKRPGAVRITAASVSGPVLTLTFDQPVVLKGTPQYTTDLPGLTVVPGSAGNPSLNVVTMTFSGDISTATQVIIPVADPAVRNKVGGFVADTTFPVA